MAKPLARRLAAGQEPNWLCLTFHAVAAPNPQSRIVGLPPGLALFCVSRAFGSLPFRFCFEFRASSFAFPGSHRPRRERPGKIGFVFPRDLCFWPKTAEIGFVWRTCPTGGLCLGPRRVRLALFDVFASSPQDVPHDAPCHCEQRSAEAISTARIGFVFDQYPHSEAKNGQIGFVCHSAHGSPQIRNPKSPIAGVPSAQIGFVCLSRFPGAGRRGRIADPAQSAAKPATPAPQVKYLCFADHDVPWSASYSDEPNFVVYISYTGPP